MKKVAATSEKVCKERGLNERRVKKEKRQEKGRGGNELKGKY